MKTILHRQIQNKVKAILGAELKYIDLYNSQYNNMDREYPFDSPAVFVEYIINGAEQLAQHTQNLEATIRIHMVHHIYMDTQDGAAATSMNAFEFFDLADKLQKGLHGFTPFYNNKQLSSTLLRTSAMQDTNHDALIVFLMDYNCRIYDNEAFAGNNYEDYTLTKIDTIHEKPIDRG